MLCLTRQHSSFFLQTFCPKIIHVTTQWPDFEQITNYSNTQAFMDNWTIQSTYNQLRTSNSSKFKHSNVIISKQSLNKLLLIYTVHM